MRGTIRRLMGHGVRRTAVILCLALGTAGASLMARSPDTPTPGYDLAGRVVNVADGDTFTLLVGRTRERIRMASIDAPETGHGREQPGQDHGQASRKALAGWVAGKTLTLRCYEHDHYGRNICDVPLADGSTVNRKMVEAGWAWANRQGHDKYLRDAALPELESRARERRLGLWERRDAVAPWIWRYQCWKQKQC